MHWRRKIEKIEKIESVFGEGAPVRVHQNQSGRRIKRLAMRASGVMG
jgi:hypothetical protein